MEPYFGARQLRPPSLESVLQRQVIALAATNAELMMALEEIAKKRKMDATAAASMKAIATKALNDAGIRT